jgi:hypothetical protein
MSVRIRHRGQKGQAFLELLIILPLYALLLAFVIQMTFMYFNVFGDMSEVRNDMLKKGLKAESDRVACYQEKDAFTFYTGMFGSTRRAETKVRLYAWGTGPSQCPG